MRRFAMLMVTAAALAGCATIPSKAEATPLFSIGPATCVLGQHCSFPISKTGKATTGSDIGFWTTGAAGATITKLIVHFNRADMVENVPVQSLAVGQFTATIRAASYARIGVGSAIGTVTAPPQTTKTCADGSVVAIDSVCPTLPPPPVPCTDGTTVPAGSTCPVAPPPPPAPPSAAGDIPAPTVAGESLLVPHDPNLDLQNDASVIPDAGIDAVGAYRQICGDGLFAYDDPVLLPGQRGASHLHDFSGKVFADMSSVTPQSLTADETVDSTCNHTGKGHASQNSVYWVAALLDGVGNAIRPDYNSVYYKRIPSTNPDCGMPTGGGSGPIGLCIADLSGLRVVSGMNPVNGQYGPANFRTDSGRPVYFSCSAGATANARFNNLEDIAAANPTCTELTEVIEFPNCSDGKREWAADRSHVVYMINYDTDGKFRCPVSNPYLITSVTIHYVYTIDGNWQKYGLSCDPMLRAVDPTAKRGACLHADVMLVWDDRVKAMRMGCIEAHRNASGGQLCNGKQLIGADQPVYGFKQPTSQRLVPIPPRPTAMAPMLSPTSAGD